jgi:hypothetical protein
MTTLSIALLCFVAMLLGLLIYSAYLNYKLGLTILRYEDALEDSLDIIDKKYNSISNVLEKPIFFDSLEVRQVISDIKDTRDSLIVVANRLTEDSKEITDLT